MFHCIDKMFQSWRGHVPDFVVLQISADKKLFKYSADKAIFNYSAKLLSDIQSDIETYYVGTCHSYDKKFIPVQL